MGKMEIKESKYFPKDGEEINANEVFMRDMRRSYPEFAKALEEFMKKELEKEKESSG